MDQDKEKEVIQGEKREEVWEQELVLREHNLKREQPEEDNRSERTVGEEQKEEQSQEKAEAELNRGKCKHAVVAVAVAVGRLLVLVLVHRAVVVAAVVDKQLVLVLLLPGHRAVVADKPGSEEKEEGLELKEGRRKRHLPRYPRQQQAKSKKEGPERMHKEDKRMEALKMDNWKQEERKKLQKQPLVSRNRRMEEDIQRKQILHKVPTH